MATIRKRGDKWRVEIYKNGVRKSKTCSTKAEVTLWGVEEEKKVELQSSGTTIILTPHNFIQGFSL